MCKYCDELEAIWFRNKNYFKGTIGEYSGEDKVLGAIFDMETDDFFRRKSYISIKKEKENWFDIRIKYCPFCGKKLTRKKPSQTIKAIIEYGLNRKAEKEAENGKSKCDICHTKIDNSDSYIIEKGHVYCIKCKQVKNGKERN